MTLYSLKPRFQAILRPAVGRLAGAKVTANQVTLVAAAGSVAVGASLAAHADLRPLFLLIPAWCLVRMALNAIDGMLAREFNQKSTLGLYLNEIADVVSDAALYLPFAFIAPHGLYVVGSIILFAALSELAGVLGAVAGASRRYDGPMGKSDRALVFGGLGIAVALLPTGLQWTTWTLGLVAVLICVTIVRRVAGGLREAETLRRAAF